MAVHRNPICLLFYIDMVWETMIIVYNIGFVGLRSNIVSTKFTPNAREISVNNVTSCIWVAKLDTVSKLDTVVVRTSS